MSRPRTPTNILELRGAFKKDPQRRKLRANEPKPETAIGLPPDRLDVQDRAAWDEIVSHCCPGVLTGSDRLTVELAARLLAELWDEGRSFHNAKLARLQSLLASFGMTPSDRSKVSVPPKEAVNPFAQLADKNWP